MPVRVGVEGRIELRHFWETAESPGFAPLPLRDREAIHACLHALRDRPADSWALRRFFHASALGSPGGGWGGQAPPHDDHELFERVIAAAIRGDLRVSVRPVDTLTSVGALVEEEAGAPLESGSVEVEAQEEVCMPCQRAAASARSLRDAAAGGTPFIAEM